MHLEKDKKKDKQLKTKNRVIVQVSGGLVTSIHVDDPSAIEVEVVDWDNLKQDMSQHELDETEIHVDGQTNKMEAVY